MSLPSTAVFTNSSGNVIHSCFVNAGLFVDAGTLYNIFVQQLPIDSSTDPEITHVQLYDMKFPIEMVINIKEYMNRKEAIDSITKFVLVDKLC